MNTERPIKSIRSWGSYEDGLQDLWNVWLALSAHYELPRAIVVEVDLALIRATRATIKPD